MPIDCACKIDGESRKENKRVSARVAMGENLHEPSRHKTQLLHSYEGDWCRLVLDNTSIDLLLDHAASDHTNTCLQSR
jgi:hypothetical protein